MNKSRDLWTIEQRAIVLFQNKIITPKTVIRIKKIVRFEN
jgi:hypothetical protein